jgi:hypothetical protein
MSAQLAVGVMVCLGNQFKIGKVVVCPVSVPMMDFLKGGKATPKIDCHYQAVFCDIPALAPHGRIGIVG